MFQAKILLAIITFVLHSQTRLYQVVSLSRHGARHHVNSFGDGNDTKPLWGELTAVGMRQHQRLGKMIRQQYINNLKFLSPKYNKNQIQIYSTPYNRTLQSILSQLYGIYLPGTGPSLNYVDKQWHLPPYSNKTDAQEQNYAFPEGYQPIKVKLNQKIMTVDCPNYQKFEKQNFQMHSDETNEMNLTYYPFFKKLAPLFNFSLSNATFYTMLRVMDVVNVDNYLGRPLPPSLTQDDQNNVFHLANWYYYLAQSNNISMMLGGGKIQKIISVFDLRTKIPDTYPLKWTFLSGHDTDIIALHLALNLSSHTCVQQLYRKNYTSSLNCELGANFFASNLIFQLHSDDAKNFYVKIRSNGKYMFLCSKKSTTCQYIQFKNSVKKYVSANIQQLCGKPLHQKVEKKILHILSSM